ncbi:hypothetical protein LTS08_008576 [Lithohypha guttulata]|nr:hypothetical protein LTS08_008576 [Lithohypha guttulata]
MPIPSLIANHAILSVLSALSLLFLGVVMVPSTGLVAWSPPAPSWEHSTHSNVFRAEDVRKIETERITAAAAWQQWIADGFSTIDPNASSECNNTTDLVVFGVPVATDDTTFMLFWLGLGTYHLATALWCINFSYCWHIFWTLLAIVALLLSWIWWLFWKWRTSQLNLETSQRDERRLRHRRDVLREELQETREDLERCKEFGKHQEKLLSDAKKELEDCEKHGKDLQEELHQLRESNVNLVYTNDEPQTGLRTFRRLYPKTGSKELRIQVTDFRRKWMSAEEKVESLTRKNQTLTTTNTTLVQSNDVLQRQKVREQIDPDREPSEHDDAARSVQEQVRRLAATEQQLREAQLARDHNVRLTEQERAKVKKLGEDLADCRGQLSGQDGNKQAKVVEEQDVLRKERASLELQLANEGRDCNAEEMILRGKVQSLEKALAQERDHIEEERKEFIDRIRGIKNELDLNTQRQTIQTLKDVISRHKHELEQRTELIEAEQQLRVQPEDDLTSLKKFTQQAEPSQDASTPEIQRQLDEERIKIEDTRRDLTACSEDKSKLEKRIVKLEREVKHENDRASKVFLNPKTEDSYLRQVSDLEGELDRKKTAVQKCEDQLESRDKQIDVSRSAMEELKVGDTAAAILGDRSYPESQHPLSTSKAGIDDDDGLQQCPHKDCDIRGNEPFLHHHYDIVHGTPKVATSPMTDEGAGQNLADENLVNDLRASRAREAHMQERLDLTNWQREKETGGWRDSLMRKDELLKAEKHAHAETCDERDALNKDNDKLRRDNDRLKLRRQEYKQDLETCKKHGADLEKQIVELQHRLGITQNALVGSTGERYAAERQLQDSKNELEHEKAQSKKTCENLQKQLEIFKHQPGDQTCEKRCLKLQKQLGKLQATYDTLQQERNRLEFFLKKAERTVQEGFDREKTRVEEYKLHQIEQNVLKKDRDDLDAEVTKLRTRVEELEHEIAMSRSDMPIHGESLGVVKHQIAREEILSRQIEESERQLGEAEQQIVLLKDALDRAKADKEKGESSEWEDESSDTEDNDDDDSDGDDEGGEPIPDLPPSQSLFSRITPADKSGRGHSHDEGTEVNHTEQQNQGSNNAQNDKDTEQVATPLGSVCSYDSEWVPRGTPIPRGTPRGTTYRQPRVTSPRTRDEHGQPLPVMERVQNRNEDLFGGLEGLRRVERELSPLEKRLEVATVATPSTSYTFDTGEYTEKDADSAWVYGFYERGNIKTWLEERMKRGKKGAPNPNGLYYSLQGEADHLVGMDILRDNFTPLTRETARILQNQDRCLFCRTLVHNYKKCPVEKSLNYQRYCTICRHAGHMADNCKHNFSKKEEERDANKSLAASESAANTPVQFDTFDRFDTLTGSDTAVPPQVQEDVFSQPTNAQSSPQPPVEPLPRALVINSPPPIENPTQILVDLPSQTPGHQSSPQPPIGSIPEEMAPSSESETPVSQSPSPETKPIVDNNYQGTSTKPCKSSCGMQESRWSTPSKAPIGPRKNRPSPLTLNPQPSSKKQPGKFAPWLQELVDAGEFNKPQELPNPNHEKDFQVMFEKQREVQEEHKQADRAGQQQRKQSEVLTNDGPSSNALTSNEVHFTKPDANLSSLNNESSNTGLGISFDESKLESVKPEAKPKLQLMASSWADEVNDEAENETEVQPKSVQEPLENVPATQETVKKVQEEDVKQAKERKERKYRERQEKIWEENERKQKEKNKQGQKGHGAKAKEEVKKDGGNANRGGHGDSNRGGRGGGGGRGGRGRRGGPQIPSWLMESTQKKA